MTLTDINPSIREWLFTFEAFRRLGFGSEDIFFECQPQGRVLMADNTMIEAGKPIIQCVLVTQGKRFAVTLEPVDIPAELIHTAFEAASKLWNESDFDEETDRMWRQSLACQRGLQLIMAIQAKGIQIPEREAR